MQAPISILDRPLPSDVAHEVSELILNLPEPNESFTGLTKYFRQLNTAKIALLAVVIDRNQPERNNAYHINTLSRKKPNVGTMAEILGVEDKTDLYGEVVVPLEEHTTDFLEMFFSVNEDLLDIKHMFPTPKTSEPLTQTMAYRPAFLPFVEVLFIPVKSGFLGAIETTIDKPEVNHNVANDREAWDYFDTADIAASDENYSLPASNTVKPKCGLRGLLNRMFNFMLK